MKKLILIFAVLFSFLSILITSCNKDDDPTPHIEGKYHLIIDGNTVADGKTEEVGMVGNAVSISVGEDFGVLIVGVPVTTGETAQIEGADAACSVSITGKNLLDDGAGEMYFSVSGTVKRTSGSKITFEGTCSELGSSEVHTFNGYVESDIYKVI